MERVIYPWIAPVLKHLPPVAAGLPRALLLTGRPGLGKRETALFMVQGLLCETQRNELSSCGTCASCRLFQVGNHPDLRMIEADRDDDGAPSTADDEPTASTRKASTQISVEKIRALTDFISITSHRGGTKVVCIVPAEAMHPSAANAVLKMLEEPPGDTCFVLVSHHPERLLATIRSRCFQLAFSLPDMGPALDWLKGQGIGDGKLALAQGGYAPLAAIERARDDLFWSQRKALLDTLVTSDFDPLNAADCAEDVDNALVATLLSQWAYDLTALKSGGSIRYHLDYAAVLQRAAAAISAPDLMSWYDSVIQFGRVARHPLNKRLVMESLFSRYPAR